MLDIRSFPVEEEKLTNFINTLPGEVNTFLLSEIELLNDISDQMYSNEHALLSNSAYSYVDELVSLANSIQDLFSKEKLTHKDTEPIHTQFGIASIDGVAGGQIDYLHSIKFNAQRLIETTWTISKKQWLNMRNAPSEFLMINIEYVWRKTSYYEGKTISFTIKQDDAYANGYVRIPFDFTKTPEWFYFNDTLRATHEIFVHNDKDSNFKELIKDAVWIEDIIVNAAEDTHAEYIKDDIRLIINGGEEKF